VCADALRLPSERGFSRDGGQSAPARSATASSASHTSASRSVTCGGMDGQKSPVSRSTFASAHAAITVAAFPRQAR